MKIKAHAAPAAKKSLEPFEYEPAPLGPNDVEIAITHCGICHSDIHLIDDDWGMSAYPLVPGHEIVGRVKAVGPALGSLKVGDRVGVGWQRSSCLECATCAGGDEQLCAKNEATCVGHHGGFADAIRTDGRFAFPIPEGLSSENAAPLLCGGITVYSPLRSFGVLPPMKVGVAGVGGLGHMAIQFARAFGCEVTAFSTSADKEAEAREFGAHRFASGPGGSGPLDFLLWTAPAAPDCEAYLNLLKPDGRLCIVGAVAEPLQVPVFPLIVGRRSVCGSPIGSRALIMEMLEFAARHDIRARTESVPMAEANAALDRVRANKARYRMVLRNP